MVNKLTRLTLISVIACQMACTSDKLEQVFSVEGQVPFHLDGQVVLKKAVDVASKEWVTIDTLEVDQDGHFKALYDFPPHYYTINFYDSLIVPFLADSGQHINITFGNEGFEVIGSKDTDHFKDYEDYRNAFLQKNVYPKRGRLYALLKEADSSKAEEIKTLGNEVVEAEKAYRDALAKYVSKMPISLAIFPTMSRWSGDELATYERIANEFDTKYTNLDIADLVNKKVAILKQTSVGGKIPAIVSADTTGNSISLYNTMKKYTLVDFWGSWCAPCRAESKGLDNLYSKYESRGFEIFGVAIERNAGKWKRALEKDNRTWPNVSDISWYSNTTSEALAITSLPKNFLIDENGIIIAKDLHGQALQDKLSELFPE